MADTVVNSGLPPQQLPMSRKNRKWRKQIVDWADSKTFFNYNLVRNSVLHKKINYDLIDGRLHMQDLMFVINPEKIEANFVPDRIQHYPIMNSKLNVLKGEEAKRVFDYRAVVTNPNMVSEIEDAKKRELLEAVQEWVESEYRDDGEAREALQKMSDFFSYEWQDMREVRANAVLSHYVKEYGMGVMFNQGFMDAMTVGEEIYQCDIVGGEPVIERVNPIKIRVFKSGYSNRIEDADMIIMEDYWSPGKVIDTFYDVLTKKDIDYIEKTPDHVGQAAVDKMDNIDERFGFINNYMLGDEITQTEGFFWDPLGGYDGIANSLLPFDVAGNIRVMRVYWKSRRRIKKVRSFDPETGEEVFAFYPETYAIDKDRGEEEESFYVNEAWEGTKIGDEIYVNMRPRVIQYNRLSSPSRCHFGIVGSIYNLNDSKPFSLVDMMKPYAYLYDVIHDRLNKLLARNWGTLIRLDISKVPNGWDIDKWLYYARTMGMSVEDSFNEGRVGAATGKLAGALNNATSGVINASDGQQIQQYIELLEFVKNEMSDVAGISRQREGQISNRETVGGVERATLQSSHITEWLFTVHEDVKKRAMECFLETAKIAMRGRSAKFRYLLSDGAEKIMDVEGDEFAECDYGIVVDNSNSTQDLNQKLETLAQAALQNQTLSFSTIMRLFGSSSLMEKQRLVERDERQLQERQQQQQQQAMEQQARQQEEAMRMEREKMEQADALNRRDNDTKVLVASIAAEAKSEAGEADTADYAADKRAETAMNNLGERVREFDARLRLEKEKLALSKRKADTDRELWRKEIEVKARNVAAQIRRGGGVSPKKR